MITNLLLDHPWVTPAALAAMLVLGVPVGTWLVRRPRLAWLMAAASLVPVLLLTLVPVTREASAGCTVQWSLPTPSRVELMANLVLFVAPALLAGVATRRPARILVAASVLSAGLEALQAAASGIGRSCDTTDWLCNSLGAVIGAGLAWGALRRAESARRR